MSEKLGAQITFRLTDELYAAMQEIARQERRKPTEIARALLERGYAAYNRDGEVFEPEDYDGPEILPIIDTRVGATGNQRAAEVTEISKRGGKKKA